MTDSIPHDAAEPTTPITDPHGGLETDPDPQSEAEVRDEQQIVDLEGGDAAGGAPD